MIIEMEIQGLDEAIERISRFADPAMVAAKLETKFAKGLTEIVTDMQANAPSRSGTYRRTIQWSRVGELAYKLGSPSKIAGILEGGSKPHDIYPRYKKALKWTRAIGGEEAFFGWMDNPGRARPGALGRVGRQVKIGFAGSLAGISGTTWATKGSTTKTDVFAKHVHHPGTAAQPHLEPALARGAPNLQADLVQGLVELAQEGI